jgi:hypothetical protein
MTTTPDLAIVLARLEMKVDQLLADASDHETRLRALEAHRDDRKWPLPTAAVGSILALVGTAVGNWPK